MSIKLLKRENIACTIPPIDFLGNDTPEKINCIKLL